MRPRALRAPPHRVAPSLGASPVRMQDHGGDAVPPDARLAGKARRIRSSASITARQKSPPGNARTALTGKSSCEVSLRVQPLGLKRPGNRRRTRVAAHPAAARERYSPGRRSQAKGGPESNLSGNSGGNGATLRSIGGAEDAAAVRADIALQPPTIEKAVIDPRFQPLARLGRIADRAGHATAGQDRLVQPVHHLPEATHHRVLQQALPVLEPRQPLLDGAAHGDRDPACRISSRLAPSSAATAAASSSRARRPGSGASSTTEAEKPAARIVRKNSVGNSPALAK